MSAKLPPYLGVGHVLGDGFGALGVKMATAPIPDTRSVFDPLEDGDRIMTPFAGLKLS